MPVTDLSAVIKSKKKYVKELRKNFNDEFIVGATFSVGGERRTFSSILREKENQLLLIPVVIRRDPILNRDYDFFNPPPLVQAIEKWGFDGVIVGTDEELYAGNNSFISLGKQVTNKMPFLRMDYFIDPVQVYETRAIGADGIFITHENLKEKQILKIIEKSLDLAMDTALLNASKELLARLSKSYESNFHDLILVFSESFLSSMDQNEQDYISDFILQNKIVSLLLPESESINSFRQKFNIRGVVFFPGDVEDLEAYVERAKSIKHMYAE